MFVTVHDFICSKGIIEPFISMSEIHDSSMFLCSLVNFGNSLLLQKLQICSDPVNTLFLLHPCMQCLVQY